MKSLQRTLRLWPGVVLVVLQWLGWLVTPIVISAPEARIYGILLGLLMGPVILLWWAFFSRAHWAERLGAVLLTVAAMALALRLLHPSVALGNLGFQYFLYAIPTVSLAFVVWAVATRSLSRRVRLFSMVATILMASGAWTLLRSEGLGGDGSPEFAWRWSETPEQRLLAQEDNEFAALPSAPAARTPSHAWPGFRGPGRDGVARHLKIEPDWSASPPVELWRRPVGPGVSSFAAGGGLIYTQEQRGEEEVVACYKAATGEPVWRHRDDVRFWDSHVGAGPRATPALEGGRVFASGATGVLNALDARSGALLWSRDSAADTGARVPGFGFVNSPLLVDDLIIVNTNRLVAYDQSSGEPRWFGPENGASYSSPHLVTLDGVRQILMLSGGRLSSVAPADGALLWEDRLPEGLGCIVQPAVTAEGDLIISTQVTSSAKPDGTHRLSVTREAGRWKIEERWASGALKPSFSQSVVHRGHAFGFDGRILACIDLEDGTRKWKGGRYGAGQVLLLPDQDLLLVLSERGQVALVSATPGEFTELGSFAAIEGKTWNQPALVGDLLLVRNGREMAAFRLNSAVNQVGR